MAKVLVVDDDKEVAESLVRFLKSRGYEASCAFDGDEAMSMISKSKPDLIFLDIQLPGSRNGIGVLEEAKKINSNIRIIMMTGYVGEETEEECKKLGANDYMIKPIDFPKMINILKQLDEGKI